MAERCQINAGPIGLQNDLVMFHQTKLLLLCLLAGFLSLGAAAARDVSISRGDIVVVPLKGEVSPSLALFIRRAEKTAESQGATAIILDMDTYGGQLESAEEITEHFESRHDPDLHLHQLERGLGRFAHRARDQAHLHGAGQCDRRRGAYSLDR